MMRSHCAEAPPRKCRASSRTKLILDSKLFTLELSKAISRATFDESTAVTDRAPALRACMAQAPE